METFIIYKTNSSGAYRYLECIYRNSVSTDEDRGDAIEFDDKESALAVCAYINRRENESFKVAKIETVMEDVK